MNQCDAFQTYDDERGTGATYCLNDPGHEGEHRFERSDWEPPRPRRKPRYADQEFFDYPDVPPWSRVEMFRKERDVLGCYVSGHPLDRYEDLPERLGAVTIETLSTVPEGSPVKVAGNIEAFEVKMLFDVPIGYFLLLDRTGYVRCKLVSANVMEYSGIAGAGNTVIVAGELKVDEEEDDIETIILVTKLSKVSRAAMDNTKTLHVALHRYRIEEVERFVKFLPEHAARLRDLWLEKKKNVKNLQRWNASDIVLSIPLYGRAKEVKLGIRVPVNEDFFSETERIFGSGVKFRFEE